LKTNAVGAQSDGAGGHAKAIVRRSSAGYLLLMLLVRVVVVALLGCLACSSQPVLGPNLGAGLRDEDFARSWVLHDQVASGKTIDAIALGPAGYVAITHAPTLDGKAMPPRNNIAAVSVDGVSWGERPIDPDGFYHSIAASGARYVAVGGMAAGFGPGRIISSTDGRTWTAVATTGQVLRRVRYTEAGFIAVGISGGVATSSDGLTWTEIPAATGGASALWDAAFGAGRFVVVGGTLAIGSRDGRQWSDVPCGADLPCMNVVDPSGIGHGILQLYQIEFGNGVFVAQGIAGLLRSSDGLHWTRVGDARSPMGYVVDRFVALGAALPPGTTGGTTRSFAVSTSPDAQSWIDRTTAVAMPSDDTCVTGRCLLLPAGLLVVPRGAPSP
jgi:hypothetical protein